MKKYFFLLVFIFILSSCPETTNPSKVLKDTGKTIRLFKAILNKNFNTVNNLLKTTSANSRSSIFIKQLVSSIGENNTKIFLGLKKDDKLQPYKTSALHAALFAGDDEITKLLIDNGADPDEIIQDKVSLIFIVIYKQDIDLLRFFIDNGANLNLGNIVVYQEDGLKELDALGYSKYLNSSKELIKLVEDNI